MHSLCICIFHPFSVVSLVSPTVKGITSHYIDTIDLSHANLAFGCLVEKDLLGWSYPKIINQQSLEFAGELLFSSGSQGPPPITKNQYRVFADGRKTTEKTNGGEVEADKSQGRQVIEKTKGFPRRTGYCWLFGI